VLLQGNAFLLDCSVLVNNGYHCVVLGAVAAIVDSFWL